jgi:hypothetical protein
MVGAALSRRSLTGMFRGGWITCALFLCAIGAKATPIYYTFYNTGSSPSCFYDFPYRQPTQILTAGVCYQLDPLGMVRPFVFGSYMMDCTSVPGYLQHHFYTDSACANLQLTQQLAITAHNCFDRGTGTSSNFTITGATSIGCSPEPTFSPTTGRPSQSPYVPTNKPSRGPSRAPSSTPSRTPSLTPSTTRPTFSPSGSPSTSRPSMTPSTSRPSSAPTTSRPSRAPYTSKPTRSPTPTTVRQNCRPVLKTTLSACNLRVSMCARYNIKMKWTGTGCTHQGRRRVQDGGCQCAGYCGYSCSAACNSDPEGICKWDDAARACRNKLTGQPSHSMPLCTSTL